MVKIPKSWLDRLVEVDFLDHTWGGRAAIKDLQCQTWGRLIAITSDFITIQAWMSCDDKADNCEYGTIIRGAITDISLLGYVGE